MSKSDDKNFIKYKFRSILSYSSTEWLSDGKKKYRRVFNREEVTYLYAELSFYNKLFDEEEWTTKVKIICTKQEEGQEVAVCEITVDRVVKIDENLAHVREGWGNATNGMFWKRGEYTWKAYIDDQYVGSQKFYVEDEAQVTENVNPFFEVSSVKLFEGDSALPVPSDRKYFTAFHGKETRYVWAEVTIQNKIPHGWYCEMFVNFYNDAGQLKGSTSELVYISGEEKIISSGWGSSNKGTWFPDRYRVEIVFMEALQAVVPFVVSDIFEEGIPQMLKTVDGIPIEPKKPGEMNEESLEELFKKLDELIGMENVKQKIKDYVKYLSFIQLRQQKGFKDSSRISLHAVLTGNPGTGKTTVAKQLGKIYKEMGLLTKGHVHEVDRAELVAEYIGQTAPKTKKAIEAARGGILFIDEAYSLHRAGEDSKDYGKEVIEILLKEMSDGPGNISIIVAGYPQEMKTFLESNPGLKSRFNHYFHFDDYIPEELMQIAELGMEQRSLKITDEAREYLFTKLTQAFRDRDRSFGNARYVMSVVDEAKMNMGLRLMQLPNIEELNEDELSTVSKEDIHKIFSLGLAKTLELKVDEKLLRDSMNELNELVGLENVKEEMTELVKLVKYYKEIGKDVLNRFVLHSVFVGNPGTGKTTVARIFSKIFRSLGILEKGHLVECDREGLVAGYSGQTAIKTADMVEKALGGVLFIDEAYALSQGNNDQFGMEAINTLLKRMEDNRDDFVVIAAGYTDNMHEFLHTNPGLKSRFERTFTFNDYTPDELMQIAGLMLVKDGLKADEEALEHLRKYFTAAWDQRDKFYGNAREVRKVIQESVKQQHLRMAALSSAERTPEMMSTLTLKDVSGFKPEDIGKSKGGRTMGFKLNRE
jgi:SpoVK/Ycf46/Vps4 family AAA+-type ATPase